MKSDFTRDQALLHRTTEVMLSDGINFVSMMKAVYDYVNNMHLPRKIACTILAAEHPRYTKYFYMKIERIYRELAIKLNIDPILLAITPLNSLDIISKISMKRYRYFVVKYLVSLQDSPLDTPQQRSEKWELTLNNWKCFSGIVGQVKKYDARFVEEFSRIHGADY